MGRHKPIHTLSLSDASIAILCHNYGIKGVQLCLGVTALDISVCTALNGNGLLAVRAVSELILRSRRTCYEILGRCAGLGLVEKVGSKSFKYKLTDAGRSVYAKYLEGYEVMRLNLVRLEDERLRRLRL